MPVAKRVNTRPQVQGALGLASLARTFFLKDQLGLSPGEVAALSGLVSLPWVIKPVYGFLTDGLPIFGYRPFPSSPFHLEICDDGRNLISHRCDLEISISGTVT